MKGEMTSTTDKQSLIKPDHYVYSHITKIPGACGGRPAIDGTRVRVVNIVYLHKHGYTPEGMREVYPSLNLAQIHSALAYYYDHPDEIQAYMDEDQASLEEYEREKEAYLSQRSAKKP